MISQLIIQIKMNLCTFYFIVILSSSLFGDLFELIPNVKREAPITTIPVKMDLSKKEDVITYINSYGNRHTSLVTVGSFYFKSGNINLAEKAFDMAFNIENSEYPYEHHMHNDSNLQNMHVKSILFQVDTTNSSQFIKAVDKSLNFYPNFYRENKDTTDIYLIYLRELVKNEQYEKIGSLSGNVAGQFSLNTKQMKHFLETIELMTNQVQKKGQKK